MSEVRSLKAPRREFLKRSVALAGAAALSGAGAPAWGWGATDPMDPERLHRWVRELCAFQPRWAGYPAEKQATHWLAERLTQAGISTVVDAYEFRKWQLDQWKVTLVSGGEVGEVNSFPVWSTRGGQGEAELVDVGYGTDAELKAQDLHGKAIVVNGKALLNVFATYKSTYQTAASLGAVAMFVTSGAPDDLIRPTSYSENYLDDNPIPAFQLGVSELKRLRRAARAGGRIAWNLDARHEQGITHDVVATLPGSGLLPGCMVICAHYDAWFTGALDNATGVSGLIGLAEYFAALPVHMRPRDMIFVGVTGHDAGYPHLGMNHWIAKNKHLIPEVDLFMNLDHLAAQGEEHVSFLGFLNFTWMRSGDEERALFTTKHPTLARTFKKHMHRHQVYSFTFRTIPDLTANGDLEGAMGELGVPSVNLTMATPHYHTEEDTPERIPPEQLSRSVKAHRDFLREMLSMKRSDIRSRW